MHCNDDLIPLINWPQSNIQYRNPFSFWIISKSSRDLTHLYEWLWGFGLQTFFRCAIPSSTYFEG